MSTPRRNEYLTSALSPSDIASRLGLPRPTPEQEVVIGAPLAPGVVVAGAGSGKTETMAARVVWLVANGYVRPEHVLGLTFTRKAARELATRIRRRLAQLVARGVVDPVDGLLDGEPAVSTYDAYAGRIVSEHALRVGREPNVRLITDAVGWQYTNRIVAHYDGPMDAVTYAPSTVVEKVRALHAEMAGHLVEPEQIRAFTAELRTMIENVPRAPKQRTKDHLYADVAKALAVQDARVALLPMVEDFRARKRRDEVVDFADQAELAARIAERFPEVAEKERETFAVVLLDEYQDTSHSQLVLLRSLFGAGHPVTAVGDPCQSIYGWRGANAGTLRSFRHQFTAHADDGRASRSAGAAQPARLDSLTTSFRNGAEILAVANRLSDVLRAEGADVPELQAFPGLPAASVVVGLHHTVEGEALDVARRAREFWDSSEAGRTIAVLVRNRSQIPRLEAALRGVDLPVEVVGVGGLLATPEVSDIVATLRVLADPGRGDALMRLLTGSRWRLGPRDLDALSRWARRLSRPDAGADPASASAAGVPTDLDFGIVDALDDLPPAPWFSEAGTERLTALSAELRGLRRRLGQSLPELMHDVERSLGLDVEVAARRGPSGRANLDRFLDVAAEFEATGETPDLASFLAYLDAAETAERGLAPGEVDVAGDRVQILTVHGAKGLEWDAVFVTGMVEGIFPAGGERNRAWLGDVAELPYPLRGDRDALPGFDIDSAADQVEIRDAYHRFVAEAADVDRLEERRLAYVAVTRARHRLVCTGYRWAGTKKPRQVSPFLEEIRAVCDDGAGEVAVWVDEPAEVNPLDDDSDVRQWPYDPLGARRSVLEEGAALVREMASRRDDGGLAPDLFISTEWDEEIDRLLAERERLARGRPVEVDLPDRLSVSQLVMLRDDPDRLARTLRRPVPREPAPLARRGTMFHAWLESRWGNPRLVDIDELPGSADDGAAPDTALTDLQEAFLSSEWADQVPLEIEPPFELPIAGVLIRGRADAIFATSDGGIDVVDWKTGRPPASAAEERVRSVQLAAYRLAFARLRDLPLERVSAAFHHVRERLTLRPADLLDEAELEKLVTSLPSREEH